MNKYAVWNNKGGVGKSFLSFVLATEYAIKHPKKKVCVIDLCPQANVSEILLGGNGVGSNKLSELLGKQERKTIGGYFDKRLSAPDKPTYSESSYALELKEESSQLPDNVLLVCGDPSLELQVQSVNQLASVDLPENRWANVHKWINDMQEGISNNYGDEVVFFTDCNPSFATYTAQAIIASNRLLVPCTADAASARAIDNLSRLLYGNSLPTLYQASNFSTKAKKYGLEIPKAYLILLNRHTTSRGVPSKAFKAMYEGIKQRVREKIGDKFISNEPKFENVPDAHAVAIVASEKACPISKLKVGSYELRDGSTQINKEPLSRYREAIEAIVNIL